MFGRNRYGRGQFGAYGNPNDVVGFRGFGRNDIVGDALAAIGASPASGVPDLSHPVVQAALAGAARTGYQRGMQGGGQGNCCPPMPTRGGMMRNGQLAMAKFRPSIPMGMNTNDTPTVGLTNGLVAAGATAIITSNASVDLRPTIFKVNPVIAPYFMVMDIKMSMRSFTPSGSGISATEFTPDSEQPPVNFPMLKTGALVSVTILNIDADPHPFYSNFWCLKLSGSDDLTVQGDC